MKTRGEDQAHFSASSLNTVITRWIFFLPPFPHGKTLGPSLLLPEFGRIVREYSVMKEIPRQLAGCSSHLCLVESCRRWAPSQHQCLHPSVFSPLSCARQPEQTVGRGQAGGRGYVSHAALSLLAEVWVQMNTQAEHVVRICLDGSSGGTAALPNLRFPLCRVALE